MEMGVDMNPQEIIKELQKRTKRQDIAFLVGGESSLGTEWLSSGNPSIDAALGGGLPKGRIVEIYGPESSGKTSLCLAFAAQAQKAGLVVGYVDMENAIDPAWVATFGGKPEEMIISQPDHGEEAFEVAEGFIDLGVNLIVVDSVASLTPRAELEGDIGDAQMGLQARLMGKGLRKLRAKIHAKGVIFIFINQLREKIGVMFGNPETTTGGNALKFYASVRLDIRRIGAIKERDEVVGNQTRVKVVKNKVAPPFREAEFEIMYGTGISREGEIIEIGVAQNLVEKSGSWYSYKGERIGQGKDNVRGYLQQHPETAREIEDAIRARVLPARKGEAAKGAAAEEA